MCNYLTLFSFFRYKTSRTVLLKLSHVAELFSKSVILHFPAEIYLKRGVGELFPLLVRALDQLLSLSVQPIVLLKSTMFVICRLSCLSSLSSP